MVQHPPGGPAIIEGYEFLSFDWGCGRKSGLGRFGNEPKVICLQQGTEELDCVVFAKGIMFLALEFMV